MGHFFHRHACLYLSHFFLLYHQKIFVPYIVLVAACHSLFRNEIIYFFFFPLKYIVYKCFSCFRPGMGHIFSSSHLSTLVTLFLLYHQKIFDPYIVLVTARLSLFRNEFFFCFKIHCLQMFQLFQTRDGPFFSSSHLSTLVMLLCCIIRKYLSYILFWSQLVSVCFAMKFFFFSFKIHCLQMFQSLQTKDGTILFIVTLVYPCHAFFAASSENICPIYIWLHHQDF